MKRSELLYHQVLNAVLEIAPNSTLDSKQVEKIAKVFLPAFGGVFAKNEIPKKRGFYVINLDNSNEPGSHWVGLFKSKKNYVYDSFGRKNLLPIKAVYTETDPEQLYAETNCGARCIAWLVLVKHWGIKMGLEI